MSAPRLIQNPQNENNAAYRAGILPKKTSQNHSPLEDELIDWDEFLKDSLAEKPSFKEDRELSNDPSDILDSWIVAEALSPDVYKTPENYCDSPRKIAPIDGARLPWEKTQKIPKDFNVFYQVFLGAIDIKKASTKLLELYKDDFEERVTNSGYAAMAVVTVDVDGIPINDPKNDISISSFPWAYGRCLNNKLEQLD